MSQQLNLLLPELQPRFDWLALPLVAAGGALGLLLMIALAGVSALRVNALKENEVALSMQLAVVQQQVQALGQSLGARQADAALEKQLAAARAAVAQRQQVLSIVAQGDLSASHAYSGLLYGFSRQIVNGVWLTGFSFAQKDIEIRGRLTDPALLPVYISRLNDEPAFAGRRFAALDMTGVDPAESKGETTAAQHKAATARYTEFVLHTATEKAK